MKFIKELQASGINGKFCGTIEVMFNYRHEVKQVNNRALYEEQDKTIYYHIVNGYVGDVKTYGVEFTEEKKVWIHIQLVQERVESSIRSLADTPKELTIEEDLCKHGFIKQ